MLDRQDFIMNTAVEQKIYGDDADAIYDAALKKLIMLENMLSFYRETSEISLLNRNAGVKTVKLSDEVMLVLQQAKEFALLSENAFSIMLAPLVKIWRRAGAENRLPQQNVIEETLELCNNGDLILDYDSGAARLSNKGSLVELGGIGKGFAADICCEIYKDMGASSAYINLGGNVKTVGSRPDGKRWSVGLQHPDKPRGNCFGAVMCSDLSVVTSGAYERYQEINGARYHHIIDGKTGWPSDSGLKSVTVISKDSIQADALSTAAFVLGLDKGLDLVYNSKCFGAVFFTAANEVYLTKGIKQYFGLNERLSCYEA